MVYAILFFRKDKCDKSRGFTTKAYSRGFSRAKPGVTYSRRAQ